MNGGAKKSLGPLTVHRPTDVDKRSTANHRLGGEEGACALANGGHQDQSKLDWATEILAAVIRKAVENPDAPFTTEALQAAAIVEEQEPHNVLALPAKSKAAPHLHHSLG